MSMRSLSLTTLFFVSLFAANAQAHDPALHELPAQKAKPATCAQLADTERFTAELADTALQTKCQAQKMEGPKDGRTAEGDGND